MNTKSLLATSTALISALALSACAHYGDTEEVPAAPAAPAVAAAEAAPATPAPEPATPAGPEYITVALSIDVDAPIDHNWEVNKGFCNLGTWFNFKCTLSGPDGIGQVRHMGDRGATEVLIAQTKYSYGYVMPPRAGQEANWNLYHGHLEAVATSDTTSRLNYTLMYDVSMLEDQAAKDASVAGRRRSFTAALETMKKTAEAK